MKIIFDLEERFWQSMVNRDVETTLSLMADDGIIVGGLESRHLSEQEMMLRDTSWEIAFKLRDMKVSFVVPDVAITSYFMAEGLRADGRVAAVFLPADILASVWVRRGAQWLCVLRAESVLGELAPLFPRIMPDAMTEEETIISLEQQCRQSMSVKLPSPDKGCITTGALSMTRIDKTQPEQMKMRTWDIDGVELEGMEVSFPTLNVAVTRYFPVEELGVGEFFTPSGGLVSVWVRQSGQWRCVLHAGSILGNPFEFSPAQ